MISPEYRLPEFDTAGPGRPAGPEKQLHAGPRATAAAATPMAGLDVAPADTEAAARQNRDARLPREAPAGPQLNDKRPWLRPDFYGG